MGSFRILCVFRRFITYKYFVDGLLWNGLSLIIIIKEVFWVVCGFSGGNVLGELNRPFKHWWVGNLPQCLRYFNDFSRAQTVHEYEYFAYIYLYIVLLLCEICKINYTIWEKTILSVKSCN